MARPLLIERTGPRHLRRPSDLVRLLAALTVGGIAVLVALALDDVSDGITAEMIDGVAQVPDPIVVTGIVVAQIIAVVAPLVVVALLLRQRTYRRLLLAVVAAVGAAVIAWYLDRGTFDRFAVDLDDISAPTWICDPATGADAETSGRSFACVPGDGFPGAAHLAALFAAWSALTAWVERSWRRIGWAALAVLALVHSIDGLVAPVEALLVAVIGYAIGAAVVLVAGATDQRPRAAEVADALARHGVEVYVLRPADVPTRNSAPWLATTATGDELFVKVIGREERAADLLYRLARAIRFRDTGDTPPFLTVRREIEHEAAVAQAAWLGSVRTPRLDASGDVGVDSMFLAFEAVPSRALATVDELGDAALRNLWAQLADLRGRRIAHRNLGVSNLVVDDDGAPWITDFGFGELGASDAQLDADVAQLLAATAVRVGADRAVDTAIEVIGPDALRRAAPRVQPAVIGSSTRSDLASHPDLLDELRGAIADNTGAGEIELERLERVTPRSVAMLVMLGLAVAFLIPQLADVRLEDIGDADWKWFPLVVLFSALTYLGATIAMIGSVPDRLPFGPTLEAQVGASFVNRISPVKIGGMATNLRYLQKRGVDPPIAVAGVGLSNVTGFVVHMLLLVGFVTTAGRSAADTVDPPSAGTILIGALITAALIGGVLLLPAARRLVADRAWPIIKESVSGIGNVASRPSKVIALVGGALAITTSYILALWYSVVAFGGDIAFVSVGAVYLAGQALAQAAPTPGGLGAAEAALVAGFTAFGLDADVAVPAVFLYRFATFWLPILPGWIAVRHLIRSGAL